MRPLVQETADLLCVFHRTVCMYGVLHHFLMSTETSEEALLKQALDMSMQPEEETPTPASTTAGGGGGGSTMPDFAMMSEEDQIAYAMQLSMAPGSEDSTVADTTPTTTTTEAPMETEETKAEEDEDEVSGITQTLLLSSTTIAQIHVVECSAKWELSYSVNFHSY